MCSVNDKIREGYVNKIDSLNKEYENEENKLLDLEQAKEDITKEIDEVTKLENELPTDCGSCSECVPESPTTTQSS